MKLWKKKKNKVECLLCPNNCLLGNKQFGKCSARREKDGKVVLNSYGKVSSIAVEPIEKKPFKQFLPKSKTLSVGLFGCSLSCDFCENSIISQHLPAAQSKTYCPKEIIDIADKEECMSICMTYNEPTIHYEYLMDLAVLCKRHGFFFILKTNGYVNKEPWRNICEVTDAINIDWKGGSETFKEKTGGSEFFRLGYNILLAFEASTHIEISIPIYPNMERDEEFISFAIGLTTIDKNIPCHLLPITPSYKMEDSFPTTKEEILHAKNILSQHLTNIYI